MYLFLSLTAKFRIITILDIGNANFENCIKVDEISE